MHIEGEKACCADHRVVRFQPGLVEGGREGQGGESRRGGDGGREGKDGGCWEGSGGVEAVPQWRGTLMGVESVGKMFRLGKLV